MMNLAPAELSAAPDPGQVLRKRLREEMEALRGILRKAELVVRRNADKGRAEPRRGKDGRFLAAEARSETMEVDRTPCAKRRKTTPPVEIIEPPPRISKADPIPCAKKRRTTLPMQIIEPRISKDEIFCLVTQLSSLSSNMPVRIVEFLNKKCTSHTDGKAGEIEIDLGSMPRSAMFELQKLLDEFAEEKKHRQQKEESMNICRSISRSSPRGLEEGEIIERGEFIEEACGASPVLTRKGLCSPPPILEDGEMIEEKGVICSNAALVATAETAKSPSKSSSSGSSSSSNDSSGSSYSDSSDSDSSDSDSDDECVTSNVAHAVLPVPKTDASTMPAKCLCSPLQVLEDGEMTEEEEVDICGDASPIATEKFVQSAKSPINNSSSSSLSGSLSSGSRSSGSSSCSDSSDSDSSDSGSDDKCVTSNPAPAVLSKTNAFPMAMPPKILSPIAQEEFAETRNSQRSNSSLLEDGEIEEEQESRGASPMAAEKFAQTVNSTVSANAQCVRSSLAPAVSTESSKPQPAAQGIVRPFCAMGFEKKRERDSAAQSTVRHFYANGFEKKRERAAAAQGTVCHLYAEAFERKRERQRAYEKLEEMERKAKAKPIFDWIDPAHLRQLGITTSVEYAVTSERRLPSRRACPVQSLLGLFLKAE